MLKSPSSYGINKLAVYLERRKSKELVGYLEKRLHGGKSQYTFTYEDRYLKKKTSIPLGPEFPLTRKAFTSQKLFSSFEDRIPSQENPAYPEYCQAVGISPQETDIILLLSTLGRKGPSSFIFESALIETLAHSEIRNYRKSLGLSVRDFSIAFDISPSSIQKLENEENEGSEVLKRLKLYLKFPKAALYEVQKNKASLHSKTFQKIIKNLREWAKEDKDHFAS